MSSDLPADVDKRVSPGKLLRSARLAAGYSEREVEDLLKLMPGYVAILEREDYLALRAPAFARGYVNAYGRLLGMDLPALLQCFDETCAGGVTMPGTVRREKHKPPQSQRTGVAVVVGIVVTLLLVLGLWWWHEGNTVAALGAQPSPTKPTDDIAGQPGPAGEQ
ncbi:helix-turn-helix domain-containing protein [Mangrovimicrobium sediminis]|nr:helix-turn-helix transcriptional regulator [Haliea sp. SAOS-164]